MSDPPDTPDGLWRAVMRLDALAYTCKCGVQVYAPRRAITRDITCPACDSDDWQTIKPIMSVDERRSTLPWTRRDPYDPQG